MNSRDLIETARGLTELSPRRPNQANLRRAVSTAYYAVFHCLAGAAANLLVGRSRGSAWHRVYRALEHGKAKSACGHKQAMKRFQPEIQYFAETFVILQDARHRADYVLEGRYYKLDVLADIDQAENAIIQFEQTDILHRRDFATHVPFTRQLHKMSAHRTMTKIIFPCYGNCA